LVENPAFKPLKLNRGILVPMPVISVSQLRKAYTGRTAVNGISFDVHKGETFALLGPNGAGKTTTIEILEGYRKADSGTVRVLGLDPQSDRMALKLRTGLVLQTTALEPELTVAETATAFRRLYPDPRDADEVLESVNLAHMKQTRVGALSGGQKRRLEIALGIIGKPELLFLDEPTTGLDPEARRKIWALIRKLNQSGCTILLSSHYMDEVQALADRMIILVDGHIAAEGRPDELQALHATHAVIRFDTQGRQLPRLPDSLKQAISIEHGVASLTTSDPAPMLHELTGWALETGVDLSSLTVSRQSLEEIYLKLASRTSTAVREAAE
jgi:ABC-2 type transport system ATP-binding protein